MKHNLEFQIFSVDLLICEIFKKEQQNQILNFENLLHVKNEHFLRIK